MAFAALAALAPLLETVLPPLVAAFSVLVVAGVAAVLLLVLLGAATAVLIVTVSAVLDAEEVVLAVEPADCGVVDELVSCESKVSAEGDGETAWIDMVTSLPWDRPSGNSLSATSGILFSRLCQKVVGRGNGLLWQGLAHQE